MLKQRFIEIDFLKGIAIICMVIFHFYYFLSVLNIPGYDYNTMILSFSAKLAQFIFIACSGINLAFSYENNKNEMNSYYNKQIHRIIKLYLFAFMISFLSYLLVGDKFVKFGILHFMATMCLFTYTMVYNDTYLYILLICLFILYFINILIPSLFYNIIPSRIAFVFGFYNEHYSAVDHFPILPWSILYIIGILLGKYLYNYNIQLISNDIKPFLNKTFVPLGKYSLEIYIIHWFVLYGYYLILRNKITK
jgi:uncharacterized membrane protein